MTKPIKLTLFALSCLLVGCSQADVPRSNAAVTTEVALSDVPQSVKDVVKAARADFQMSEVLKKVRDGRVYYDVEGELPGDVEIEFDVLMTEQGPKIVEIQRDIVWSDVPSNARKVVDVANKDNLEIVRIIESVQTDNSIIYEVFVAGHSDGPRFEVQAKAGEVHLLPERWKH